MESILTGLIILLIAFCLFLRGWLDYKTFLLANPRYKLDNMFLVEKRLHRWYHEMYGLANVSYEWDDDNTTFRVSIKEITNPNKVYPMIERFKENIDLIRGVDIKELIYEIE